MRVHFIDAMSSGLLLAAAVALVSTLGATTMADVLDEGLGGDRRPRLPT